MILILLTTIFFVTGLLHLTWAIGNNWGFKASLPTKETGETLTTPTKLACCLVGLILIAFGLFYLQKSTYIQLSLPTWAIAIANWLIPTIFFLRTIGDFKYVGIFRKVKNTTFGKLDKHFFTPLCLVISLLAYYAIL